MSKVIILIDDEEAVVELLTLTFEQFDQEAIPFCNTDDAFEYIESTDNVILFCTVDLYMPGIDGLEFSKILYKNNPDIPVILISGNAYKNLDTDSTNIVEFVQKPLLADEIKKLVEKYT